MLLILKFVLFPSSGLLLNKIYLNGNQFENKALPSVTNFVIFQNVFYEICYKFIQTFRNSYCILSMNFNRIHEVEIKL